MPDFRKIVRANMQSLVDWFGRDPVTRMMARRLELRPVATGGSLLQDGSSVAKESGEAISAILAASPPAVPRVFSRKGVCDA